MLNVIIFCIVCAVYVADNNQRRESAGSMFGSLPQKRRLEDDVDQSRNVKVALRTDSAATTATTTTTTQRKKRAMSTPPMSSSFSSLLLSRSSCEHDDDVSPIAVRVGGRRKNNDEREHDNHNHNHNVNSNVARIGGATAYGGDDTTRTVREQRNDVDQRRDDDSLRSSIRHYDDTDRYRDRNRDNTQHNNDGNNSNISRHENRRNESHDQVRTDFAGNHRFNDRF